MDMMEDAHDVLQGVGPKVASKLDGDIGGGDLDSARSTNLVRQCIPLNTFLLLYVIFSQ